MWQKMLCIILTCFVFNSVLIISDVVYSEEPIKADEQTGKYPESLGSGQHRQTSVKYNFEQHGSQYSKDSMNHRNSPRWNALVVDLSEPSRKRMYLQDSMNKRNNPGGKYYESVKINNPAGNVTDPQRTVVTIPVKQW